MGRAGGRHRWLIAALTAIFCAGWAAVGRSQFTPFSDHRAALLEGNWQSCREGDGEYSERVYDGRFPGLTPFELHMGPYHEFALFQGVEDGHREHRSTANLLRPYTVEVAGGKARQRWQTAGMVLEVVLAGGSRDECESWFVTLKRLDSSTSH